ncbi:MAG: hypothetical protein J6S60_09780 [Oscillospiraceae bacterium]|nr:hypothetical protein [Oscillospiraceae bacterium]
MATQYLSKTGLTYLWGRITALFQPKEAGKGLSTNDLTDAMVTEIEKITQLETQVTNLVNEGGEPNVIESVKVNGTALAVTDKAVDVEVPEVTAWGENQNDGEGNFISLTLGNDNYSVQLKKSNTGWDISYGDSGWNTGTPETTKHLPDEARVNALIAAAQVGVTWEKVAALPDTGEPGKMYLLGPGGSGQNIYEEWIWINSGTAETPNWHWENIGTTAIDLSGYLQTTDVEAITTAEIDEITGA